ncbi:MAG: LysM peptidoglycan-binding domain-containing protein [Pseudomonadaceae bacterium]|nr:LysM peptidoglycan-binding domain-containing protein [Pseudomonadaceae bacterium]
MPVLSASWPSTALKRWQWAALAVTCALATNACTTSQPTAHLTTALMDAPSAVHVPQQPPRLTYQLDVAPQTSLWPLLRAGFQLDHRVDEKRVQQEIAWLKRHPDYLKRIGKRAERYLAYMHIEISKRGLPSELALLPIVESALDPYAFSPGGAAGLWQFIPATAKRFGVTMNWWFEGRRDPVQATDGALNYLQVLHNRFDDWPHALASYNTGEGRVARSIRRARAAGKPTDFFNLKLPRETAAYVPRLLAYAAVVADPARYGIELPQVGRAPGFQVVELDGQYDIAVIAREIGVDPETLYRWNPALNQWATPPGGPHRLLIPSEFAQEPTTVAAQLAQVPVKERVQFARYVVKPGDALSTIARRNDTDTATLVRVNHLRSNRIKIGQALLIPKASMDANAYPTPLNQRQGDTYIVASGDSLWTISRRFDVGMTALMKLNEVGPKSTLRVGQEMLIPASAKTTASSRAVALPPQTNRTLRYAVRRGDSLHRIANKFGVTVAQISRWNSLDASRLLQPGQMLKLTVNATSAR